MNKLKQYAKGIRSFNIEYNKPPIAEERIIGISSGTINTNSIDLLKQKLWENDIVLERQKRVIEELRAETTILNNQLSKIQRVLNES